MKRNDLSLQQKTKTTLAQGLPDDYEEKRITVILFHGQIVPTNIQIIPHMLYLFSKCVNNIQVHSVAIRTWIEESLKKTP